MLIFIVSFGVWALLHSITASRRMKTAVRRIIGEKAYEGLYRLAYNLFSIITFLPVLYILATEVPNRVIWRLSEPYSWLAYGVQIVGFVGLTVALWQTDILDFAGLRQFLNYVTGDPDYVPAPQLVTNGMYSFVRHPLYFFSLLVIWFNPILTMQGLIFNVMATIYFWAGSRVEERRLAETFGEAYERYRRRVPGLIPIKLS